MMNEPKMCELHAKCVILVRSDFFSRTNKCSEAIILDICTALIKDVPLAIYNLWPMITMSRNPPLPWKEQTFQANLA